MFLLLLFSLSSFSQTPPHWGVSLSIEAEKEINRFFSVTGKEEVRLLNNSAGFDRNAASLGIDYTFLDRKAKIGVYYAFLYLYNNDCLFESRHRCYINLSCKETFEPFILSWRGRLQETYRDASRGKYKINPKYAMKNKLEAAYMIWGSPWKPYLSCDFSTRLNDPVRGCELTKLRLQGGATWRLDRTTYLDFFLRCDEYLAGDEPRVFSLGAAYKMKF
ncbi:MAG: DUF2490 domain-containing protein [Dysgonamonadaceae bacterium]|nr:DUF2490 domain-containing protein [Dysgonamonadaceae bacterium]